jgi:hypothetical protein
MAGSRHHGAKNRNIKNGLLHGKPFYYVALRLNFAGINQTGVSI